MIKVSSDQDIAPDVTIGIPVYRPDFDTFVACLDSIYSQLDFYGIVEVLVVVDGEDENRELLSSAIFDDRPWLTVFVQKHGGECAARNTILRRARGKWLVFVDADDKLSERGLMQLVAAGESCDADIVASNHWRVYPRHTEEVSYIVDRSVYTRDNCISFISTALSCGSDQGTVWAKAFRLSFIRKSNLWFDTSLVNGVDQEFVVRAVLVARTIIAIPDLTYFYIYSSGSIVRSFNSIYPRLLEDTIEHMRVDLNVVWNSQLIRRSFSDYCLDRFLMLIINYIGHPDFPAGYRARRQVYRDALDSPYYSAALHSNDGFDSFSLARRVVLTCAKRGLFVPVMFIAMVRHRQLLAN